MILVHFSSNVKKMEGTDICSTSDPFFWKKVGVFYLLLIFFGIGTIASQIMERVV